MTQFLGSVSQLLRLAPLNLAGRMAHMGVAMFVLVLGLWFLGEGLESWPSDSTSEMRSIDSESHVLLVLSASSFGSSQLGFSVTFRCVRFATAAKASPVAGRAEAPGICNRLYAPCKQVCLWSV